MGLVSRFFIVLSFNKHVKRFPAKISASQVGVSALQQFVYVMPESGFRCIWKPDKTCTNLAGLLSLV